MRHFINKYELLAGLFWLVLSAVALPAMAQDRDTTKTELHLRSHSPSFKVNMHRERSVSNVPLPSSGIYSVPEETRYYKPPFKGQHYLDMAVEAYREELKDKLGLNWLFNFMNMLAPYVHNQFEFGVYQIDDLPVVERDNALFQSNQ